MYPCVSFKVRVPSFSHRTSAYDFERSAEPTTQKLFVGPSVGASASWNLRFGLNGYKEAGSRSGWRKPGCIPQTSAVGQSNDFGTQIPSNRRFGADGLLVKGFAIDPPNHQSKPPIVCYLTLNPTSQTMKVLTCVASPILCQASKKWVLLRIPLRPRSLPKLLVICVPAMSLCFTGNRYF